MSLLIGKQFLYLNYALFVPINTLVIKLSLYINSIPVEQVIIVLVLSGLYSAI
jgi:hypothetical protein